jgi:uncharacterized damage-inducible protein DinB
MEIKSINLFLEYYKNVRGRTLRVIHCIPPEKFDWTYREGKFTFADLIRHLAATERFMFAENIQLRASRYPGHSRDLADGYEQVFEYLNRLHEESLAIFSRLTDKDLQQKCQTPNGTPITIWKWLRAMIEHEIHHRGQIYLYLSILGIQTPPIFGLTSEEVYEKSPKSI